MRDDRSIARKLDKEKTVPKITTGIKSKIVKLNCRV